MKKVYTEVELKEMKEKLFLSRTRILCQNGFFGVLTLRLGCALADLDKKFMACTDGKSIYFNPDYLLKMSSDEVDFVFLHEIMHVALKHVLREYILKFKDHKAANIAADIIVNSNIFKEFPLFLKNKTFISSSIHKAPDKSEGYLHSFEELYELYKKKPNTPPNSKYAPFDSHKMWGTGKNVDNDYIDNILKSAYEVVKKREKAGRNPGNIPGEIERYIKNIGKSKLDWRRILHNFITPEICDYSFSVPDRRFSESYFILPSFSEDEYRNNITKKILFMVDTSASMSIKQIEECYAEILGAIDEFSGQLEGFFGVFDVKVYDVLPFSSKYDITNRIPKGGGGTSFIPIFEYILSLSEEKKPDVLVVLSDGYAFYPNNNLIENMEVLWIFNNNKSQDAPFGRTIRIDKEGS